MVDTYAMIWPLFYFVSVMEIFSTAYLFCDKFVIGSNFYSVVDLIVLILWVKVWYLLFACIVIKVGQKKHHRLKSWRGKYQPQKDVFGQHKQSYYWVFLLLILILSQSHHTHKADKLTYTLTELSITEATKTSYPFYFSFYLISALSSAFSQSHDEHIETDVKIYCRTE